MRTLFANEYFDIGFDDRTGIVRFHRRPPAFASVDAATESFARAFDTLASIDRGSHALLIDMRDGPSRNDPEFENAVAAVTRKILGGFRARATLVRTAAGRLQVNRLNREHGRIGTAFTSEEEALDYLSKELLSPPGSPGRRADGAPR